jgi:hypothetical protein
MKHNIFLNALIFSLVLCAGTACTKNFQEINTDPTLVTKDVIKPGLLLTTVLKGSIFDIVNRGTVAEYSGYCKNPASGDIFITRHWDDPFSGYYRNYLINTAEIIRLTADNPAASNENAIGRIWKVWLFHQLTDTYGDVPYFDAVQDINKVVTQPVYDAQQDIYKDMLKELKEAATALADDPGKFSFGDADILFKGDVSAWKRFANSLRLRLAMRVRYADASLAQENITDVLNAALIDDNSQSAILATLDDGNNDNANQLYVYNLTQPGNMLVSFTVTDNLKRLNDPRLSVFAKPALVPAAGYRGAPLQLSQDQNQTYRYSGDSTSLFGDYFLHPVLKLVVMNAAEVKFLRAEAALAGLSAEDAQALYTEGIQDAMDQYQIDPTQTAAYLASAAGVLNGTDEEKLEQIIVQKWLAMYYQANEGWAEFRRTGYPRIWTGGQLGDTEGNIPRRLIYSGDEYFKNTEHVKAAAALLSNGDTYMSHVWWDKKPGVPFAHPKQGMFPPDE